MKKLFFIFVIAGVSIVVIAFMASPNKETNAAAISPSEQVLSIATATLQSDMTAVDTPTLSATPTATLDQPATIAVLQAQLDQTQKQVDDLKRQAIDATMQANQLTATYNDQQFQLAQWDQQHPTDTPIPTSTPNGTATTISIQITLDAPKQLIAMSDAQAHAQHAGDQIVVDMFFKVGIAIFCIAFAIWIFKLAQSYQQPTADETETGSGPDLEADRPAQTVIIKSADPIYPSAKTVFIPFTKDELMSVANYYAEVRTLAIGQWDKIKNGRQIIIALRKFCLDNKFAYIIPSGQAIMNQDGELFFEAVRAGEPLPHRYEINPNLQAITNETNHVHENHERENKPGEGLIPFPANS